MKSAFTRALVGFTVLTSFVTIMAYIALWAVDTFGGGAWWASGIIILIALIAEIMLYGSTLHDPIYRWIRAAEDDENRHKMREHQKREFGQMINEAFEQHEKDKHK